MGTFNRNWETRAPTWWSSGEGSFQTDVPSKSLRTILASKFGTARDAAEICGVTPQTIHKWMAAGKIARAEKRGATWRLDLDEVKRLRDSEVLIWLDGPDR